MAGRKRKNGKRTKSGQISRAGHDPRDYGTPQVQRRVKAMKGKGSADIVTDRLCAQGRITDLQNQAAAVYRDFRERGYGKASPGISAYDQMIAEGTLKPIYEMDPQNDPQAKAEANYRRGWAEVHQRGRVGATVELTRVVIENYEPVERDFYALVHALDLLAALYFRGERASALDGSPRSGEGAQEMHSRNCA